MTLKGERVSPVRSMFQVEGKAHLLCSKNNKVASVVGEEEETDREATGWEERDTEVSLKRVQ